MPHKYLFTSESVASGHPDKIADQISDAILDACLAEDSFSRVACETLVCSGLVMIAGEITSEAKFSYQEVARRVISEIGYDHSELGFDYRSCGVVTSVNEQSSDIALGVDEGISTGKALGAGDQGLMFGFACNDTPEYMPLPIMLAHRIIRALKRCREDRRYPYLRPDGKTQVTIEYDDHHNPLRLHTVVLSVQHSADIDLEVLRSDMKDLIAEETPEGFIDHNTLYFINPTGRFVIGGPCGDCGLTGRKIIVDTYGGMGRHGGGAFSGKDPTKVDRSASYMARYIAKNIIAAGVARRCELQISYAIGLAHPIAVRVDTFGTGIVPDHQLGELIPHLFDLSPKGIIESLNLRRPIYQQTAFGGHFGRDGKAFSWENSDRVDDIRHALKLPRTGVKAY